SRFPVKRLADALGYEVQLGRAYRVERGVYKLGTLTPAQRRRIEASQCADDVRHQATDLRGVSGDPASGGLECLDLRGGGPLRARDDRSRVPHLLAGRRSNAGDVRDNRLRHLRADELRGLFLGRPADLTDHDDG